MRKSLLFITFLAYQAWSQCPVSDFTISSSLCMGQDIDIVNTSTGGDSYYSWDLCSGDLQNIPTANAVFAHPSLFRARCIVTAKSDDGNWFGFTIDEPNNTMARLSFGTSLDNSPVLTDLANPSNALSNAYDMELLEEDGNWYALIANKTSSSLLRLSFGSSLENIPAVSNLGTLEGLLQSPSDIDVVRDNGSVFAFITNGTTQVARVSFGNSITNAPTATIIEISGSTGLRGISLVEECGEWFGLITSYGSNSLYYVDFNSGLEAEPASGLLQIPSSAASYSFPSKVEIVNEGGEYFAFIQSAFPAKLYRISFGESILDKSGEFADLGNFGISNDNYALHFAQDNSHWRAFSIDLTGAVTPGSGRLVQFSFPNSCATAAPIQEGPNPQGTFSQPGNYRITLQATSISGQTKYSFAELTVTAQTAPDISVDFANQCALHDVNFSSLNESGDIVSYDWDFGDMTAHASEPNPSHQYIATGEYTAAVQVTASNGCINTASTQLKVYPQPVTDFILPSGLLCSNNEYVVENTTPDVFDGQLSYAWYVDASPVSDARDLAYEFPDTGPQTIKLITTIPGCSDEVEKVTSSFLDGPTIDFSFEGKCQSEDIAFSSLIAETVTDHTWNFDDGTIVNEIDPQHAFAGAGMYSVALTATSANGCNNTTTKQIQVFSKPETDFELFPPPQSCSGVPTPFFDLTPDPVDSELATWSWNFGDVNSLDTTEEPDPVHTFTQSGDYIVSLTVTTDEGCTKMVEEQITIYPSPVVNITNTPACLNEATSFAATADDVESFYWEIGTSYYESSSFQHTFQKTGEHNVTLTVVGDNNCISFYDNELIIPQPLIPEWSVTNNCKDFEAQFTDLTTGTDPVEERLWDFNGEAFGSGATVAHVFPSEGWKNVVLQVTAASGCQYSSSEIIEIVAPPVVSFSASPVSGAAPLKVQLANQSTEGTYPEWNFGDGNISVDHSPVHVFENIGSYLVQLLVTNDQGCESTTDHVITTEVPRPDVSVNLVTTTTNPDGSTKIIVILENKGNTVIEDLLMKIDVSGSSALIHTVEGPILPGALLNVISDFSIPAGTHLPFICVEAALPDDLVHGDDRYCAEFTNTLLLLDPYPNPVFDQLTVDWISPDAREVDILLTDAFGRRINHTRLPSQKGLNQVIFDVAHQQTGVYFLTLRAQSTFETRRIVISRQN